MIRSASAVVLSVVLAAAAVACNKGESSSGAQPGASSAALGKEQHVEVLVTDKGFEPSEVKLAKGQPAMLMFKRTTDETCATAVDFPELKVKKDLPLNQVVSIEVPTGEARTLGFQCGMGMFKSKVVVQ